MPISWRAADFMLGWSASSWVAWRQPLNDWQARSNRQIAPDLGLLQRVRQAIHHDAGACCQILWTRQLHQQHKSASPSAEFDQAIVSKKDFWLARAAVTVSADAV